MTGWVLLWPSPAGHSNLKIVVALECGRGGNMPREYNFWEYVEFVQIRQKTPMVPIISSGKMHVSKIFLVGIAALSPE